MHFSCKVHHQSVHNTESRISIVLVASLTQTCLSPLTLSGASRSVDYPREGYEVRHGNSPPLPKEYGTYLKEHRSIKSSQNQSTGGASE